MTKYSYWLLGALLAAPVVHASDSTSGWQHIGTVTRMKALPNGVEVQAGRARVRIVAISDSVIRVRLAPDGTFQPDFSWAVVQSTRPSPKVTVKNSSQAVEVKHAARLARREKFVSSDASFRR